MPAMQFALSRAAKSVNSKAVRDNLGSVRMSACAAKLAAAVADPFSEEAKGACFPLYPAPDSHKIQALSRFDGVIGSEGVGYIAICPSLGRNTPCGFYTSTTSFNEVNVKILEANGLLNEGVAEIYHDGPYTAEQLVPPIGERPDVAGRVVAIGVRVTYTGTALNESGTTTLLMSPNHGNLSGYAGGGLQSFAQAEICPFTRRPCSLSIVPTSVEDGEYPVPGEVGNNRLIYPYSLDGTFYSTTARASATGFFLTKNINAQAINVSAPVGVIMVTGVPGNAFHVDMVHHLEYTGRATASVATPNSVDVSSVHAILTAAAQLTSRKMASPSDKPWKLLMDGIRAAMGSPVALTVRGIVSL